FRAAPPFAAERLLRDRRRDSSFPQQQKKGDAGWHPLFRVASPSVLANLLFGGFRRCLAHHLGGGLVMAFGFLSLGFQVLGFLRLLDARLFHRRGGFGSGFGGLGLGGGFTGQALGFLLATAHFTRVVGCATGDGLRLGRRRGGGCFNHRRGGLGGHRLLDRRADLRLFHVGRGCDRFGGRGRRRGFHSYRRSLDGCRCGFGGRRGGLFGLGHRFGGRGDGRLADAGRSEEH